MASRQVGSSAEVPPHEILGKLFYSNQSVMSLYKDGDGEGEEGERGGGGKQHPSNQHHYYYIYIRLFTGLSMGWMIIGKPARH
ncbi:hypothetical protein GE21DRAFT_1133187 [Neurospora crassa]|nr:hypothetical protein GE21DRAFT_1133187 [Neurospora crassa]